MPHACSACRFARSGTSPRNTTSGAAGRPEKGSRSSWARMSSARPGARRATVAAVFAAVGIVALAFAGTIVGGEQFYFRDVSQNHGPILQGARALLWSGQAPWWNPWSGGGQPLLANPNSLLLHPFGLLALVMPAGAGLMPSILLSSLLGAIFLVLLLRD